MSKKKEYPPLSPLALKIKSILEQNVTDWYDDGKVKGLTVSAVKIEKLIKKQINEIISWIEMGDGGWSSDNIIDTLKKLSLIGK